MKQTKNQDYAEYLAADFIDNRFFEDMSIREYVEGKVYYSDVVSRDAIAEDYATKEEAIEDFVAYIGEVYEAYQRENNL